MSVTAIIDTVTSALILSSMYILCSLGFAFILNMLGIINLAHGAIYMTGAYLTLVLINGYHLNCWIALLLSALVCAAFGTVMERGVFRPFNKDFTRVTMACVAVMLFMQTTISIIVGNKTQAVPPFFSGSLKVAGTGISFERIGTFAIGVLLLLIVLYINRRTKIGRQMQAVAQNRRGAELQGINVPRVSAFASAIGLALASIAGSLMGAYISVSPYMGNGILSKIMMIVMLAGIGSTGGVIITGFIIGILDSVLPLFVIGNLSDLIVTSIVIVLLLIRPQGFFGYES